MPLNASNRLYLPFDTLLTARLRAAQNPLRIPKVLRKAVLYSLSVALKYTLFTPFYAVPRRYPG